MRVLTGVTELSSMSRPKESKRWPSAVRKSSAALHRLRSKARSLSCGRYQATTFMPWACAWVMNCDRASGWLRSDGQWKLDVSMYSVRTP